MGSFMVNNRKCDVFGYVHNGDEAPQSCPVCGADISHFSPLEIKRPTPTKLAAKAWQCSKPLSKGSAFRRFQNN
jgi:hypothetical protein